MRLIPKNTKVSQTIWKNFTLLDVAFAFVLFMFFALIFMSNIQNKWVLLLAYGTLCAILFLEKEGIRMYRDIVQIFKYATSQKTFKREKEKHKKNTISKLIPYSGFLNDGTINYEDYYARVISVGSIEFRLLTEWSQNNKISALAQLLNTLSDEQSMQLVKIDRPVNFDKISANLFNKIKSANDPKMAAILKSRLAQIDVINNVEKQYRPFFYIVFYDTEKSSLDLTIRNACNILRASELDAEPLNVKETALFLKYCYTRHFDEREIDDLKAEQYMDYIVPHHIKFGKQGTGYTIDNVSAFNFAIADYPLEVANAWGAALFDIDNTKVVLNIRPTDKIKAIKRVDAAVAEMSGRENNKASQHMSQATHLETMGALLQSIQNENEALFDCTLTITGFNNEKKPEGIFRKQIRQSITGKGFKINSLQSRQIDAFISANISRRDNLKIFERGINSQSLAAVFPFVFTSIIEDEGITIGHSDYPIVLDIWKRGKKYTNSNCMIVGKSGGGKSYFAKTDLVNLLSDNCKVYILDPEDEYTQVAKNLDGKFIDVGSAIHGRFNPFHIYPVMTDNGASAPPEATFMQHLRFLESFLQVTLPGIHSDTLELINNMISECYENCGIYPYTDCTHFSPDAFPTFDSLMDIINKAYEKEQNVLYKTNLQRAQSYMTKFAKGGRYSNLWNGAASITSAENLVVLNFKSLLAGKNNIIANGQMLLIIRYLEQQIINLREYNENNPNNLIRPIVIFDEGYNFVDTKYPVALDFVYHLVKTIRKYYGSIIFITQNISDFTSSDDIRHKTMAIIKNTQYSFIFPLLPSDTEDLIALYSGAGGINETEKNEIENNDRGQVFLISAPTERTSFHVVATELVEDIFSKDNMKWEEIIDFN